MAGSVNKETLIRGAVPVRSEVEREEESVMNLCS